MKRALLFLFLLICSPILLSFDSTAYDDNYFAYYKSPEGISFLSYTENWNEQKLKDLYKELIKNKHGAEIKFLQEVRVKDGPSKDNGILNPSIRGHYNVLTSTITIYHGDQFTKASELSEILSHEYGHHFSYYYFKTHHFPFSKWSSLRGLNSTDIYWDAFWNYSANNERHKWYPQEIIADDYILLFSAPNPVKLKDVYNNEAFYLRTEHENQDIPNIYEQLELHRYISKVTGIKVDEDRLLETPTLLPFTEDQNKILYSITKKANVAYRLTINYEDDGEEKYMELLKITDKNSGDTLEFLLNEIAGDIEQNSFRATLDVLDLNTGIGLNTGEECMKFTKENHLKRCSI
ncbi:hypothetical protein [Bacillus sp. Marseille-P3661]|uniref:hypothetical protein n=1 Tax=Bacillus sp. Marseille-P3661 TaxID=1936234 RepID=UPI000C847A42|nr:hypothetical protein [Bacillus sp. Marseille-P3661]